MNGEQVDHQNRIDMKPEYKTMLILVFFVIVLILLLAWSLERGNKFKKESEQRATVIGEKNAIIEYHVNDKGKIVAQKEAAELKASDLEKAYPEIYKTLKEDMDVNFKRLKAFVQNEFEARGSGTGNITNNHYYDSASGKNVTFRDFHMDDGYLTFDTRLFDSLSTSLYKYTYRDTAKTAIHGQKKWYQIFKSEKLYATTTFSNPSAKITGTTNIIIDNYRDKRIIVSVGMNYLPFCESQPFQPGIHVGYALFKF